jgi:hypothetical protein
MEAPRGPCVVLADPNIAKNIAAGSLIQKNPQIATRENHFPGARADLFFDPLGRAVGRLLAPPPRGMALGDKSNPGPAEGAVSWAWSLWARRINGRRSRSSPGESEAEPLLARMLSDRKPAPQGCSTSLGFANVGRGHPRIIPTNSASQESTRCSPAVPPVITKVSP